MTHTYRPKMSPYCAGAWARYESMPLRRVPYGPGPSQDEWLAGWRDEDERRRVAKGDDDAYWAAIIEQRQLDVIEKVHP